MTREERKEVRKLAGLLQATHNLLRRAEIALGLEIDRGYPRKSTVATRMAILKYFARVNK